MESNHKDTHSMKTVRGKITVRINEALSCPL